MQLEDKANSSSDAFIPESITDVPQKKRTTFPGIVVTIFSILFIGGALTLPSLMSCGVNKAKQAEAKQNVGVMNRAQQANFLEKNALANSIEALGIGIRTQTVNYNYSIRATKTAAFHYAVPRLGADRVRTEYFGLFGGNFKEPLKSYVGAVFIVPVINVHPTANKSKMTTLSIICEAINPDTIIPSSPTIVKGVPTCGADTKDLNKR